MKTYNFNVRALHCVCIVLAMVLIVDGLQAIIVANADNLAGTGWTFPGLSISKIAIGLFLSFCAVHDAIEKTSPYAGSATYGFSSAETSVQGNRWQPTELVRQAYGLAVNKHEANGQEDPEFCGVSGCAGADDSAAVHRKRLEECSVHSLAHAIFNPNDSLTSYSSYSPKEAGAALREALDAFLSPCLVTPEASKRESGQRCAQAAFSAMQEGAQVAVKGQKVTTDDIEAAIDHEFYFSADDGFKGAKGSALDAFTRIAPEAIAPSETLKQMTFCVLVMKNGFKVVGVSACADPAIYSVEEGVKWARADAVEKIWPLLGYELRNKLAART